MAQRHDDALFIQAGACNPQGVSKALARAYDEAAYERRAAGTASTSEVAKDPACQLILHQLCHLAGIWTRDHAEALALDGKAFNWQVATDHCARLASDETLESCRITRPAPLATETAA